MPVKLLNRWEPRGGGTQLQTLSEATLYDEAADTARLADVTAIQALTTAERTAVASLQGLTLAAYDTLLEGEEWVLRDRLDYYAYDNKTVNVRDGAWFTPEAVESFSGEHVTNVATNSIDGNNTTIWQDFTTATHQITYRLRGYPKRIERVRFRYGTAEPARERLTNLVIKASRDLSQIDAPNNTLDTGVNPTWPAGGGVDVEHVLATAKSNARYVKLEFDTEDASNNAQVREFSVWVTTRLPTETLSE